jgi:hypothetical protein
VPLAAHQVPLKSDSHRGGSGRAIMGRIRPLIVPEHGVHARHLKSLPQIGGIRELMPRLGDGRYGAQGCDWGSFFTARPAP